MAPILFLAVQKLGISAVRFGILVAYVLQISLWLPNLIYR